MSRKRRASVWVQELELEGQRRIIQRVNSGKGRAPASSIPQPLIVKLHTEITRVPSPRMQEKTGHRNTRVPWRAPTQGKMGRGRMKQRAKWMPVSKCGRVCVERGRGRPVPLRRGLLVFQHGTRPHSPPWPEAPNWTPAAALQTLGWGQGQPQLPWFPLAVCPHVSHRLRRGAAVAGSPDAAACAAVAAALPGPKARQSRGRWPWRRAE